MRKFVYYAAALFVGMTMTTGLTSCSDDDHNDDWKKDENNKQTEMQAVIETYVDDVVYYTYGRLADASDELYDAIDGMRTSLAAGTLTDEQIESACDVFLDARAWWEKSEAWLYGPADVHGIDPHIDTWPLSRSGLASFLKNNANTTFAPGFDINAAISTVSASNNEDSWLGFHGLEFILFRDGKCRTAADFRGVETASEFAGSGVSGALELDFALAVAGDLRDHCYWLEVGWKGTEAPADRVARCTERGFELTTNGYYTGYALMNAGTVTLYPSRRNAISTILDSGCMNIAQEVSDQKMGQVWRCATGNAVTGGDEPDSPDYIESPYSHKSFQDFYDNIVSIQNALYGNIEGSTYSSHSIMAYLNKYNAELAENLQANLDASFAALNTCLAGRAFVEIASGGTQDELDNIEKAMQAINGLNTALNEAKEWVEVN